LLIHGFTGSPQGMREMGEYLAGKGMAVVAPRLPGHGTTWQDLNGRSSEEWVGAVDTAFEHLASQTEEIFVVGLSFGAALSLDLVQRHPDRIAGVVTLAGMVFSKDPRRHLAPLIARLVSSIPGVGNDIFDGVEEIAYDRVPTRATYSMLRFIKGVQDRLPEIDTPILVIHAHQDHTVHPDNAQHIYDRVSSKDKELVWLDRSFHVITLDVERAMVFERTLDFIKERSRFAV
jgi:carboxylesterase